MRIRPVVRDVLRVEEQLLLLARHLGFQSHIYQPITSAAKKQPKNERNMSFIQMQQILRFAA